MIRRGKRLFFAIVSRIRHIFLIIWSIMEVINIAKNSKNGKIGKSGEKDVAFQVCQYQPVYKNIRPIAFFLTKILKFQEFSHIYIGITRKRCMK